MVVRKKTTKKAAVRTAVTAKRAVAKKATPTARKAAPSATRKRTAPEPQPKKAASRSPIKKATMADQGPKVKALVDEAKAVGWAATVVNPVPTEAVVTIVREDEVIIVTFAGGKLDRGNRPTYTVGGSRTVLLKGASGVRKQMVGEGKVPRIVTKRPRKEKNDPVVKQAETRIVRVPFNIREATDEEVLAGVAGRKIIWKTGTMLDQLDEARLRPLRYCPACGRGPQEGDVKFCWRTDKCNGAKFKDQKSLTIREDNEDPGDLAKRYITFVDVIRGCTRSVRLSSLVVVR